MNECEYMTYDQFFATKKPARLPKPSDMIPRKRAFSTVAEWNKAVSAGKVTSMESRLARLLHLSAGDACGLYAKMTTATIRRIKKGYL